MKYSRETVIEVTRAILIEAREKRGRSSVDLAKLLGCAPTRMQRILAGEETTPLHVLLNAIDFLGGTIILRVELPEKGEESGITLSHAEEITFPMEKIEEDSGGIL